MELKLSCCFAADLLGIKLIVSIVELKLFFTKPLSWNILRINRIHCGIETSLKVDNIFL